MLHYMTDTGTGLRLAPLPPETWGSRLRRARVEVGDMSLEAATAAISDQGWPVSHATLGRIEASATEPTNRKHRIVAVYALVLYGVDPADFGLSLNELPRPASPKWTDAKTDSLTSAIPGWVVSVNAAA